MKIQLHLIKKSFFIFIAITCFLAVGFNLYYLLHSHQQLLDDYFKLNDCFYKSDTYALNFFNEKTKQQGNILCVASIIICSVFSYLSIIKIKRLRLDENEVVSLNIYKDNAAYYLTITLCSMAAWLYGLLTVRVSYDEVFSAQKCTDLPIFQTLTYYMLPNNHIGFNLLNKIFFFWVDDKVMSGKIISLIAYLFWNYAGFYALKILFRSKPLALLASLVLSLQFGVWGFSFEARGYELYGLCEFLSFLLIYAWWVTKNNKWLFLNTIISIVGYACLPTFLYMQIAQLLFGLWLYFKTKRLYLKYYRYQLYILCGAFIFFLPALCYSGVAAFTQNKYVAAQTGSYYTFMMESLQGLPSYFDYAFSQLYIGRLSLGLMLSLLPLILFFNPKIRHKELLVFYMLMLSGTFLVMVIMRRNPYHRNLLGHFYILLFVCMYIYQFMWYQVNNKIFSLIMKKYLLPLSFVVLLCFFGFNNARAFNFMLYFDDLKSNYNLSEQVLEGIPAGASISCSDGAFYLYYLAGKRNYKAQKCSLNQTMYFINGHTEKKPATLMNNYKLQYVSGEYDVYKRLMPVP